MSHYRVAVVVILIAAGVDLVCAAAFSAVEHTGFWLSVYWAVTTATTVGFGDITPRTSAGHIIAILTMLTTIPLFAATFSLMTSGLTGAHVRRAEKRIKAHMEDRLRHHVGTRGAGGDG